METAYSSGEPATMVHVRPDGAVYAFAVGAGVTATAEPKISWQTVSKHGVGGYVRHFAV